jgi:protein tyrosine phosphatase (PTP) superfamily phosphohydrolase (DUF442 family)
VAAQAAYFDLIAKTADQVEPLARDLVFDHPIHDEACLFEGERDFARMRTIEGVGTGVSQFSLKGLERIRGKIDGPMLVLDLREESHFFTPSGEALHARGLENFGNTGRSFAAIIADEMKRSQLAGGITEAEACARAGVSYYRIAITDDTKPRDEHVDQLVALVEHLERHPMHVVAHCRAGWGRTTTALTMIDILRHGDRMTLDEIVKRQHQAGGVDLFGKWEGHRAPLAAERVKFLERFYAYARWRRHTPEGLRLTFSEWNKR